MTPLQEFLKLVEACNHDGQLYDNDHCSMIATIARDKLLVDCFSEFVRERDAEICREFLKSA